VLKRNLIVALGAMLAVGQAAFGANLLLNPGFEDGVLPPWTNSSDFCGGCTWSAISTDAQSGTWSAEVDGNRLLLQTFAAVNVGLINQVSFWARHPDGGLGMAVVLMYDDATETEDLISTVGTEWEFFDVTSFLAPGKNLVGFGVYGNSGGLARFDSALVDARESNGGGGVPEPATFALMGAGLAAVALRRRMRG